MLIFGDNRAHLFRPLDWSTREKFVCCLLAVHERLYGPEGGTSNRVFDRAALLETIDRALASAPTEVLPAAGDEPVEAGALDAPRVVRVLEEHGWLEARTDPLRVTKVWQLTPVGRKFTQTMWEIVRPPIRTRHRYMRSCVAALENYVERGEVDDLVDAEMYAEQVIAEMTKSIEGLRESMRDATRDTDLRNVQVERFRSWLVERFKKEHAPELTADSAMRLRSRVMAALGKLRALPDDRLEQLEAEYRERIVVDRPSGGYEVFRVADNIERVIDNAVRSKTPEILASYKTYVNRMTSLVRQSAAAVKGADDPARQLCDRVAKGSSEEGRGLLQALAEQLMPSRVRFYDPLDLRFNKQRIVVPVVPQSIDGTPDPESVIQSLIRRRFEDRMLVNELELVDDVVREAGRRGGRVRLSDFPVETLRDLLRVLALFSVAPASPDVAIRPRILSSRFKCRYFETHDIEFTVDPPQRSLAASQSVPQRKNGA